ncbi:hypothetical protein B4N89_30420 [Embleya scabrispora]|uniref:non-specific serine/threonine protein kinase n=2 Tax=Embleya scabrispora TaxID=159449 RepID=A0A1T3P6N8_9ACTN|nr:hypothetical protein B4N89_30420 [Embleya scabrispora]
MVHNGHVGAGRYELSTQIGSGGMGLVWLAKDTELHRPVAIKCARLNDVGSADRLREEARIAARFSSAHIVNVYDTLVEDDTWWLVMEYVPSRSLAQIIREQGLFVPEQAMWIGHQVARALQVVHRHGVVHGDVTPENILVTGEWVAKLADFGISRALGAGGTGVGPGVAQGKPRYLAPEVVRAGRAGRASDMFSLGATLFAAIEGCSPYGATEDPITFVERAVEGLIDPPTRAGPLTRILTELLSVEPTLRPDATHVAERLAGASPPATPAWRDDSAQARNVSVEVSVGCPPMVVSLPPLSAPVPTGSHDASGRADGVDRRWWVGRKHLAVAAVVVATVVTAALVVAPRLEDEPRQESAGASGSPPASPNAAPATPALTDVRAVDPCALLDPTALSGFGATSVEPAFGNFDRCDLLVRDAGGDKVAGVRLVLGLGPRDSASPAPGDRVDDTAVATRADGDGSCRRLLRLPDRIRVTIASQGYGDRSPDVCRITDLTTERAARLLRDHGTPPRSAPPSPESLARQDACRLLGPGALGRVPGIEASAPEPGFGNWRCRWRSTAGKGGIDIQFDRSEPPNTSTGRPGILGGRQAFVSPEIGTGADAACTVRLVHRSYPDPRNRTIAEIVLIKVSGIRTGRQLCETSEELGAAVTMAPPSA